MTSDGAYSVKAGKVNCRGIATIVGVSRDDGFIGAAYVFGRVDVPKLVGRVILGGSPCPRSDATMCRRSMARTLPGISEMRDGDLSLPTLPLKLPVRPFPMSN
jgi:hypothetical protein